MPIPPEFQPLAWYTALALISAGGSIIAAGLIAVVNKYIHRMETIEKSTTYLMGEDKLEKAMAEFYEKDENSRRRGERRGKDRE